MPHLNNADACDFTVLICTHNNASLLQLALEHLAVQQVDHDIVWEVIVVENNCDDETASIVDEFQTHKRLPRLQYCSEPKQGVAYARRTGMLAASGRLIGFVDDDCLVAPNWIAEAVRFAAEHPQAGAFGGQNELLWQCEPPEFVSAYGESLARQNWGDTERCLPRDGKQAPCGAGVVLRRDALLQCRWLEDGRLRGREPKYLGAGEDTEIVLQIRNAGWEIWYTPRLQLRHVIPPTRMTLNYLRRLHRGFGRAEVYLRNIALRHDRSLRARCDGLWWACGEMIAVWRRFWLGYVRYVNERPSWLIRLSFAIGCVEGALRFLVFGSAK